MASFFAQSSIISLLPFLIVISLLLLIIILTNSLKLHSFSDNKLKFLQAQMGNLLSGPNSIRTPRQQLPPINLSPEELRWYKDSVKNDEQVHSFDAEIQTQTIRFLDSLALGNQEPLSFSFDLLREFTGCLLETNLRVVDIVLSNKEDILNTKELYFIVQDYFGSNIHRSDVPSDLKKCLKDLRSKRLSISNEIVRLVDAAQMAVKPAVLMEDMERFSFRPEESDFISIVLEMFESINCKQLRILQRLQTQRLELDKKFKRTKSWRKITNVLFGATFVTVLVCSVLAAVVLASCPDTPPPPRAVTAMGAAGGSLAGNEIWFEKLWKGFENTVIQEQREMIRNSMQLQAGKNVSIRDTDDIRGLVEKLKTEMTNGKGKGNVKLILEEMETKISIFDRKMEEFGAYLDCYSVKFRKGTSEVLYSVNPRARRET